MGKETERDINDHKEISFLHEKDYDNKFLVFVFTYIFSTDHKTIGKQYLFTGIFWALAGSFLSLIFRLQLGFPEVDLGWLKPVLGGGIINGRIDPDFYLSMVTMHGTIMIFFVLTGGFIGSLGNFLIPLQIGARDMASGFMNMLSYWIFFLSGLVMLYSFFTETGAASCWLDRLPSAKCFTGSFPGCRNGNDLMDPWHDNFHYFQRPHLYQLYFHHS